MSNGIPAIAGVDTFFNGYYWTHGVDQVSVPEYGTPTYGNENAVMFYADGNNNFDYGDGDNYLYTFSGYGSWLFDNGVYFDLIGKVGRMNNEFDISANGFKSKGDYHTNAASISAEIRT